MRQMQIPWERYELQVFIHGSGPNPLVLLHGGGVDSAMLSWREVMENLPQAYTAYALDLPGYGGSDCPDDMAGPTFYPRMKSALSAMVDFLGLESFVLCGLSMGGAISIGYALENPNRVAALMPVDSWGLVSRMPLHRLWVAYVKSNLTATAFRWFAKSRLLVRWSLTSSLIGDRACVTDALVDEVSDLCRLPGAERSMQDFQRSSLTLTGTVPDYTADFQKLAMPTLYLCGQKDILVRAKDCVKAAEATPDGKACILNGSRHWAQKDRPDAFLLALDNLTAGNRCAQGSMNTETKEVVYRL